MPTYEDDQMPEKIHIRTQRTKVLADIEEED